MALHSKNIAISAGIPTHLVEEAAKYMIISGSINQETSLAYMKAHNVFNIIRKIEK
jgi:hypothetical protein